MDEAALDRIEQKVLGSLKIFARLRGVSERRFRVIERDLLDLYGVQALFLEKRFDQMSPAEAERFFMRHRRLLYVLLGRTPGLDGAEFFRAFAQNSHAPANWKAYALFSFYSLYGQDLAESSLRRRTETPLVLDFGVADLSPIAIQMHLDLRGLTWTRDVLADLISAGRVDVLRWKLQRDRQEGRDFCYSAAELVTLTYERAFRNLPGGVAPPPDGSPGGVGALLDLALQLDPAVVDKLCVAALQRLAARRTSGDGRYSKNMRTGAVKEQERDIRGACRRRGGGEYSTLPAPDGADPDAGSKGGVYALPDD